MSILVSGYYEARLPTYSPLMAPGHQMQILVRVIGNNGDGLEINSRLQIDGATDEVFERRIWLPNELADIYELAHHKHHGYDPRGLDPRVGSTRLKP